MKMTDREYYFLLACALLTAAIPFTYAILGSFGEKTDIFTFFYVYTEIEDLPEYYVMTLEKGEVYFRGNITDPEAGKSYRITYVIDHSVKVRRYIVKKCEVVE